jgi:hypothetical protein
MCAILREDAIGFDSRIRVFFVFLPTIPKFEANRLLFLIGSVVPEGRVGRQAATHMAQISFEPSSDFC